LVVPIRLPPCLLDNARVADPQQFNPDLIGDLMFNGVATNVYRASVANGLQGDSAFRVNEAHTLRAVRSLLFLTVTL
jgi:hypothetical protein